MFVSTIDHGIYVPASPSPRIAVRRPFMLSPYVGELPGIALSTSSGNPSSRMRHILHTYSSPTNQRALRPYFCEVRYCLVSSEAWETDQYSMYFALRQRAAFAGARSSRSLVIGKRRLGEPAKLRFAKTIREAQHARLARLAKAASAPFGKRHRFPPPCRARSPLPRRARCTQ